MAKRTPVVLRELVARHGVTLTRLIEEDIAIAFSNIADVLDQRDGVMYAKDVRTMSPEFRRTVASATTAEDGSPRSLTRWDRGAALDRLAQLLTRLPSELEEITLAERASRLEAILQGCQRAGDRDTRLNSSARQSRTPTSRLA